MSQQKDEFIVCRLEDLVSYMDIQVFDTSDIKEFNKDDVTEFDVSDIKLFTLSEDC